MRWVGVGVAALVVAGCGSAQPDADPLDALTVGVEPRREADEVARSLAAAGFVVARRVDWPRVTALGLARRDPAGTAARVITSRGVAFFLDASPGAALDSVTLLDQPAAARPPDLDGDGEPEVVLLGRPPGETRACAVALRIGADGTAAPIRVDTRALGPGVCIEDVTDLDGDGRSEAIAVQRFVEIARGEPPTMEIPLVIGADGTARVCACVDHWSDVRQRLGAELMAARSRADVDTAYRVAIELAALAARNGDRAASLEAFDTALEGVVLDEEHARAVGAAREFVSAGMRPRVRREN